MSQNFLPTQQIFIDEGISTTKSAQSKFWSLFKHRAEKNTGSPVVCLEASPLSVYDVVASYGTRAEMLHDKESEDPKVFAKSKDVVYSASFRSDGKLLAVGNAEGQIMIYDVESKLLLRTLQGHKGPVRSLKFMPNKVNLVSSSDDKSVRVWDVAGEAEVLCLEDNSDYVRTVAVTESNHNILATGAYDGFAKVYDLQLGTLIASRKFSEPIEAISFLPGGSSLAVAYSNRLAVWNMAVLNDSPRESVLHQKTISSLWINPDGKSIITGSLDHQAKAVCLSTFQVLHSWSFAAAIMSLSVNVKLTKLYVGLSNGFLAIRARKSDGADGDVAQTIIGSGVRHETDGSLPRTGKISKISRQLQKFHYRSSFETALTTENIEQIVSVSEELRRRNGLQTAISGLSMPQISLLIRIIRKNIVKAQFSATLSCLTRVVLDCLTQQDLLLDSSVSDELVKLYNQIGDELESQNLLLNLSGAVQICNPSANL